MGLQTVIDELAALGVQVLDEQETMRPHGGHILVIPINIASNIVFEPVEVCRSYNLKYTVASRTIDSLIQIRDLVNDDIKILKRELKPGEIEMNKQERIEQCKNDITKLQESLRELEKPGRPLEGGDIVTCDCGERIVLFDNKGRLAVYDSYGRKVAFVHPERIEQGYYKYAGSYYKYTGNNLFKDNLLNLGN